MADIYTSELSMNSSSMLPVTGNIWIKLPPVITEGNICGAMRARTANLLRARQALSQLSYSPFYTKL